MEKRRENEQRPAVMPAGALPQLIDTHCHLADPRLQASAGSLIARAEAAGVRVILAVGAIGSIQTDRDTVAIAEQYRNLYAVIGVHPHDAGSCDRERMDELAELARCAKVVAIGETGMDLHYRNASRAAQEEALRLHLRLARRLSLPVVKHCREAESIVAQIVGEEGMPPRGGAIHCFTGSSADAARFLELGLYLSFSGILTFKNAAALRETARLIPEDRLLIETDAPYLTPEPHRGHLNEPAYVQLTLSALARVRNAEPAALAARIMTNAATLFGFSPPPVN